MSRATAPPESVRGLFVTYTRHRRQPRVLGAQGKGLEGFYQKKVPSKIVLSAELVTKANAKDYYVPESVY